MIMYKEIPPEIINIATNVNNSQDLTADVVEHRVCWNAVSGGIFQILSAAEDGSNISIVYQGRLSRGAEGAIAPPKIVHMDVLARWK